MKNKTFIIIGLVLLFISCVALYEPLQEPIELHEVEQNTYDADYMNILPKQELEEEQERQLIIKEIDEHSYIGTIQIPSYDIKLSVLSEVTDENLDLSACRYVGSPYDGDLIICAHNYKNWFWHLHSLSIGDEIIFTNVEGEDMYYKVSKIEEIYMTEVDQMKSGDWDLTLFTCMLDRKFRLAVRCDLI